MKWIVKYIPAVFLVISLYACAAFTPTVKTEVMKDEQIMPGNYTAILYGARHSEDLETVALLDYEGDDVTFEPFAPEYDYTTHMYEDKKALEEALKFVSWYPSFLSARLSRIMDLEGKVLGYELRPLYSPFSTYGHYDVLRVNYVLKDKKLVIRVRLTRSAEDAINGDGERRHW